MPKTNINSFDWGRVTPKQELGRRAFAGALKFLFADHTRSG